MMVAALIANPTTAVSQLIGPDGPPYVIDVRLRFHDDRLVVLDVDMAPVTAAADAGYPMETVTLYFTHRGAFACPRREDRRTWEHRLAPIGAGSSIVPLCLWYPDDPNRLRWTTVRPIEELLGIVYRHVQFEEYFRREGEWLGAEAPHGAQGLLPVVGKLANALGGRLAS